MALGPGDRQSEGLPGLTYKPRSICNWPGCQTLILVKPGEPQRCTKHPILDIYERAPDRRGSASSRGYDSHWEKLRRVYITQHPVCEVCGQAPAEDVDHIMPIDVRPELRLVESNLQAICRPCHNRKTKREDPVVRERHGTTRSRPSTADRKGVDPEF